VSIENFVMEWLPVIFLKSRSLAWLRGDLGAVWMLPARQLQRQAVPPGVGFRSPGAEIDCLAGKLRPGRHPNEPLISPTATFAFPPCFGLVGDLQA